jgi:hypothetical protein
MPRLLEQWGCNLCNRKYQQKEEAIACEKACELIKEIESLKKERQKYFPTYHASDDRYEKHCVDCGKKVAEWEYQFDGHRSEPGAQIFQEKNTTKIMGGRRCKNCSLEFEIKLTELQKSEDKTVRRIFILIALGKI